MQFIDMVVVVVVVVIVMVAVVVVVAAAVPYCQNEFIALKMEAEHTSVTSVYYKTTQYYIQEGYHLSNSTFCPQTLLMDVRHVILTTRCDYIPKQN
jgi:hypothetical protein